MGIFRTPNGTVWLWYGNRLVSLSIDRKSTAIGLGQEVLVPPAYDRPYTPAEISSGLGDIFCAAADRDGYIWVTRATGVLRYDVDKREWARYPEIKLRADSIFQDTSGRMWFASRVQIAVFDPKRQQTIIHNIEDEIPAGKRPDFVYIQTLFRDRGGNVLIGLSEGLLSFNEYDSQWRFINPREIGLDEDVANIAEDNRGRIWILTSRGIAILASNN